VKRKSGERRLRLKLLRQHFAEIREGRFAQIPSVVEIKIGELPEVDALWDAKRKTITVSSEFPVADYEGLMRALVELAESNRAEETEYGIRKKIIAKVWRLRYKM